MYTYIYIYTYIFIHSSIGWWIPLNIEKQIPVLDVVLSASIPISYLHFGETRQIRSRNPFAKVLQGAKVCVDMAFPPGNSPQPHQIERFGGKF